MIYLVYANPVVFPYAQPYGLTIIRDLLKKKGLDSAILTPFHSLRPNEDMLGKIKKPKIIGFSFRNLDPAGFNAHEPPYTFISSLKSLIMECKKKFPDALIVVGGSGFSIDPVRILRKTGAHIGFVGPSENDFAEFAIMYLKYRVKSSNPLIKKEMLNGINSYLINEEEYLAEFNLKKLLPKTLNEVGGQLSFAPNSLDYAKLTGATIPIRTKTGCSLKCIYCVVPFIENLRLREIGSVIQDIKQVAQLGQENQIFFADGELNLPRWERLVDLCEEIQKSVDQDVSWRCYVCPSSYSDSLPGAMKAAGCVGVGVTVDSFSDSVRKIMGKACSALDAIRCVEGFLKSGIETHVILLYGGPGETIETVKNTAEKALYLMKMGARISLTIGLRVYPNTPLEKLAKAKMEFCSSHPLDEYLVFSSPMPRTELQEYISSLFPEDGVFWTQKVIGEENFAHNLIADAHLSYLEGKSTEAYSKIKEIEAEFQSPKLSLLKAKVLIEQNNFSAAYETLNKAEKQLKFPEPTKVGES